MTGFGRAAGAVAERRYAVEVRTLNSRYCDVKVHLPRELAAWEDKVARLAREAFERGRIDIQINLEGKGAGGNALKLDEELLAQYVQLLRRVQQLHACPGEIDLKILASFREAFVAEPMTLDWEREFECFAPLLRQAFSAVVQMRREEGKKLALDLDQRLRKVKLTAKKVAADCSKLADQFRCRLRQRVQELMDKGKLDEGRLEQEVVLYAERSDVTEELVRLDSHLKKALALLKEDEAVGRKLDFLLQEMNREINTLGVKAQDAAISQQVVEIKSELERIREQIQNLQ